MADEAFGLPILERIERTPVGQPHQWPLGTDPLQVERVIFGKVVAAVGREHRFVARFGLSYEIEISTRVRLFPILYFDILKGSEEGVAIHLVYGVTVGWRSLFRNWFMKAKVCG